MKTKTKKSLRHNHKKTTSKHKPVMDTDVAEDYYDAYDAEYETETDDYDVDRPGLKSEFREDEWKPYSLKDEMESEEEAEDTGSIIMNHRQDDEGTEKKKKSSHGFANYKRNSPGGHNSRFTGSNKRRKKSEF